MNMKMLLLATLATGFAMSASAQVTDTVKEGAKSVGESAQEGADKAKGAMSSQPDKTIDKGKAQVHKAKAKYHRHKAKKAADNIGH
jgi:hypothetical protein